MPYIQVFQSQLIRRAFGFHMVLSIGYIYQLTGKQNILRYAEVLHQEPL